VALLDVLAIAIGASLGLSLLGVALLHAREHVGFAPFVVVFALAAAAVPALAHRARLWLDPLGSVPGAFAIAGPVAIGLVVLVHLVRGQAPAHHLAWGIPLVAALATGLSVAGSLMDLGLEVLVASDPLVPLLAGTALWLGAIGATVTLRGLYRALPKAPSIAAAFAATLFGLGIQGGALVGLDRASLAGFSTGFGGLTIPVLVGMLPTLLVGVSARIELGGLKPRSRRLMVDPDPLEGDDRLETVRKLEQADEDSVAAVRENAQRYERLLDSDTTGAYVCDREGMISYANKALRRLIMLGERDLTGKNIRHLLAGSTDDAEGAFVDYPITPGTHRAQITLPNGTKKTLDFRVKVTDDGEVQGRVVDQTEETLRDRVEEEKERAEFYLDLLRQDVDTHVETPLEYLRELESDPSLDESQRRYVTASRAAVENIADVLERVDLLERAENAPAQPVHVNRMMHRVAQRFSDQHPDEATMQLDLPDEPVIVAASPLLEHVLANLVENAIQHAKASVTVRLGARRDGDDWVLFVDDDGPGLPDEFKTAVFERDTKHEASSGRGLGLYIVDTIVRGMNGDVWVTDRTQRPQDGASFRVRLPAVHADAVGETSGHQLQGGPERTQAA
jgi:signal transduction histidine kinase